MSNELKGHHRPTLMVPYVVSFSVVIYTNGVMPAWSLDLRDALIAALPPGTGVGEVTCTNHGVYDGKQGVQS